MSLCCVAGVAPNVSLSGDLVRVRSWKSTVRVVMALELYSTVSNYTVAQ